MEYYKRAGESVPDNLFAGPNPTTLAEGGTIAAGEGKLKRGTLLGTGKDGKLHVAGKTIEGEKIEAESILCDAEDASEEDVFASVYVKGCFNENALIAEDGYEIDKKELRKLNIYLKKVTE